MIIINTDRYRVISIVLILAVINLSQVIAAEQSTQNVSLTPNKPAIIFPPTEDTEALVFHQISDPLPVLIDKLDLAMNFRILVDNGIEVDRNEWQANLVAYYETSGNNPGSCSAVIIGPNTVLTAAHCILKEDNSVLSISTEISGQGIKELNCTPHPQYITASAKLNPRNDYDYALCIMDGEVQGITFETLELNDILAVDKSILITGFGCSEISLNEGNDIEIVESYGVLRIGEDNIFKKNVGIHHWGKGSMVVTLSTNDQDPNICPSDSGGPVYSDRSESRRIVGLNSAVHWEKIETDSHFFSIIAPVAHQSFKSFLNEWTANNHSAQVCSSDSNLFGCR